MGAEGAHREDGPRRRPQLPDGHVRALLGHHPPGGHLVREERPQLDRHALLHPPAGAGGAAVLGVEERLGHLQGDREEVLGARDQAPAGPTKDVVAMPLAHDTPAEIAQPEIKDWIDGRVEAIPGKTMPAFKVVERDYPNLYNQFCSYGRAVRENGLGAHGTHYASMTSTTRRWRRGPSSVGTTPPTRRWPTPRTPRTSSYSSPR